MVRLVRLLAFLWTFAAVSTAAIGGVVVLDFEEFAPVGNYRGNVVSQGFRISPYTHLDIMPMRESDGNALSSDSLARNPDFLGPPRDDHKTYIYIDYFGQPFSLTGFDYSASIDAELTSSKGGSLFPPPNGSNWHTETISGPDWLGVKWLLFTIGNAGAPAFVIDNLTFRVPTPRTLPLLAIGAIVLLAFGARASRRSRIEPVVALPL